MYEPRTFTGMAGMDPEEVKAAILSEDSNLMVFTKKLFPFQEIEFSPFSLCCLYIFMKMKKKNSRLVECQLDPLVFLTNSAKGIFSKSHFSNQNLNDFMSGFCYGDQRSKDKRI